MIFSRLALVSICHSLNRGSSPLLRCGCWDLTLRLKHGREIWTRQYNITMEKFASGSFCIHNLASLISCLPQRTTTPFLRLTNAFTMSVDHSGTV